MRHPRLLQPLGLTVTGMGRPLHGPDRVAMGINRRGRPVPYLQDPEINNNYGWYLCQTGRVKESIEYFQRALRNPLYQTPEIAYLNVGACHVRNSGELDLAEDYIRKTLRFSPDNFRLYFNWLPLLQTRKLRRSPSALDECSSKRAVSEILWLLLRVSDSCDD